MKYVFHIRYVIIAFIFFSVPAILYAQPGNDNCSSAITLTSGSSCSNNTYSLQNATSSSPAGACGGATTTTTYDVWFRFQANATTTTITLSNLGQRLSTASTYIQVLSGASCASFTSLGCQSVSTGRLSVYGLSVGTFYYIRVYVLLSPTANPASKWNFDICVQHNPVNDDCAGAVTLTPGATCINTAGTLDLSTANASGVNTGCSVANTYNDVWYKFTATATTNYTATLSSLGANITTSTVAIQIYSGACGSLTYLSCANGTTLTRAVTNGTTYYLRISNSTAPTSTSGGAFNICLTTSATLPPNNDNCSGAISLTSGTTCTNISGTMINATVSGIAVCGGINVNSADVWYSFVAQSAFPTITLTHNFPNISGSTTAWIQVFSSCGGASLGCSAVPFVTATTYPTGLTVGNTYYFRIATDKNTGVPTATTWNFTICVTDPVGASLDFGKSYINITDGTNGGTIDPGDTLEIRATLVVPGSGKSIDSVAYYDTLISGRGFRLVPGTIALRTNEGKIYRADSPSKTAFTDAFDSDAGYYTLNGADTAIRINMGTNATGTKRGQLDNTSRPSFYGGTCIIMATYRVVVNAPYGTKINYGGGTFTARDRQTGIFQNINFAKDSLMVYSSPGLCPNAVSTTNSIGAESNGTFGVPSGSPSYLQNRGTSANTNYIYAQFTGGNGPNDYYYGVANNTSGSFSTNYALDKSDGTGKRVFGVWDITGDHTNATNTAKGNLPCDINSPISATNPCGYMLVINSAFNTDTAFQYAVSNLCPNTNYEISAWFKNICYKCGCDSVGRGSSTAGYIPTGTGDSSGVRPNIAFDIDGTDYYTTGNIPYYGTTPRGSDSTNIWVKRGFTIRTDPTQTSFLLTLRNNAPGGGGNDWAIDDIKLATCLPNMTYSPSLSPTVCDSTVFRIYDTVRSYFNTYNYYKWQRSTDNGVTWSDVTGTLGPTTPTFNGINWEYVTNYNIPVSNTNVSDSGNKYRVNVATTSANLSNNNCIFTDGTSIVTLNIVDCLYPLKSDLLSANGKIYNDHAVLSWTTSKEGEPITYDVEKSIDGVNFIPIGTIKGNNNTSTEINYYSYTDPEIFSGKPLYRILMKNNNLGKKYSRIIQLIKEDIDFSLSNITNPFGNKLEFDVRAAENTKIEVALMDIFGKKVKSNNHAIYAGVNRISLTNTDPLSHGIYILQVKNKDRIINSKVMKK